MSQQPNNFLENLKSASQRFGSQLVDAGAKTMLKTDMVFLERDIKTKKQQFGLQIYDILSQNSATVSAPEIQRAFEELQNEIKELEGKLNAKQDEMRAIDRSHGGVNVATHASSDAAAMEYGGSP